MPSLSSSVQLPRSRDLHRVLHAKLRPIFHGQWVRARADRLVGPGKPVRDTVSPSHDDLVDRSSVCGELIDSHKLDVLEASFGSEMQDRRPLCGGLLRRLTEVAGSHFESIEDTQWKFEGLCGIQNGQELAEVFTGYVRHSAGTGFVCCLENGTEVGGIARKEVAVHVVQRMFDLTRVKYVSDQCKSHKKHSSSPGR